MDLLEIGSWGYQIGALGIVAFTACFLIAVRWWTDLLGKILAFVFGITSLVLLLSAYRSITQTTADGFLIVRVLLYWTFAIGTWTGLFSFFWFQFFAPRIRQGMTTRREARDEKADLARTRPGSDGDRYDRAGSDR